MRAAAGVGSGDELEDGEGAGTATAGTGAAGAAGAGAAGTAVKVKGDAAATAPGAMEVDPATPAGSVVVGVGVGGGKKRRRGQDAKPTFRNWQPPEWDKVETVPTRETQEDLVVEEDAEGWMKHAGLAGQVKRTTRINEVSKIRRLGQGTIERYRVVRTVEYVVPGNTG